MTAMLIWPTAVLAALLTVVSWIDLKSMRIPDELNAALCIVGLIFKALNQGDDLSWALLSGGVAFAGLWLVRLAYSEIRGRQGLGLGDVKLAGAGGIWVGMDGIGPMLFISSVSALAVILGLQLSGRRLGRSQRIPFGPFLSLGLFVVWSFQTYARFEMP